MTSEQRLPDPLPGNPLRYLERWIDEAREQQVQRNPNAMTLATVGADGRPAARIVLLKGLDTDRGHLVFYTNYRSDKCRDIDSNPEVALTFHWDALGRQARIQGPAERAPENESDAYFASRPRGSQLGAWGSDQSQPIESRDALVAQLNARSRDLESGGEAIPRPPHWGGIRVHARTVELWVEGADRIHDRARFERTLPETAGAGNASAWTAIRLQP